MATQTFQGIQSGITLADVKRALANGGDVSFLTPVLARALNNPPLDVAATLEVPLTLPGAELLLSSGGSRLSDLIEMWHRGEGYYGKSMANIELELLPLPHHGKNVAAYLERAVNEVRPDILALDEAEGEVSSTLRYDVSLPAAFGTTVYAEIRLEEGSELYGKRVFYPGGLTETAIVRAWLDKLPLVPVGKPYWPGDEELQTSDEDTEDEDGSGLHIQSAYQQMDGLLETGRYLSLLLENAGRNGEALENSVSTHINHKLINEVKYTASRLLDLAFFLNNPEKKVKILAVLDMKHYSGVSRYLKMMLSGGIGVSYVHPDDIKPEPMLMLGQHGVSKATGVDLPEKTVTQRLFEQAFVEWADAKSKEVLDAESVDRFIAGIMERVRTHPHVLKGASVRGSLGLKEIVSALSELSSGVTRENIEKAALITLPSRLRLKPGVKASREDVVSESAKEALYGIEFYRTVYSPGGANPWLSPEEINRLLEALSQKKKPERDKKSGVDEEKRLKYLEANKLLRRSIEGGFALTARSIERLLQDLEERSRAGKISAEDYEQEKARLKEMLAAAQKSEYELSAREIAEIVIDLMEVVDKGYEKAWGNDINFIRLFTYYRLKLEGGQILTSWQKDFTDLKYGLDLLERRGILKTSPLGERTLSGQGLAALLGYVQPRNQELMNLKAGITRNRTPQSLRGEEIRPFTAVNSYRDISFRHTLKEVARQQKELENIRQSDFRVYLKPRKLLATDIVICLDTSGSIADHRKLIYERLGAAAITAAAKENGDRTAVVSFEDAGQTSIALSDESNDQVNDFLVALKARGGTNMGDGIKCAVDLLTRDLNHNKKRIFLITDGEPNIISEKAMKSLQGKKEILKDPTEEAVLVETRRAAARGITVSVIFLAADEMKGYNFVKSVARAGNGSVIMLNCRDEVPIITESVKKTAIDYRYERTVNELDEDDVPATSTG